jgi:hypothetical protein
MSTASTTVNRGDTGRSSILYTRTLFRAADTIGWGWGVQKGLDVREMLPTALEVMERDIWKGGTGNN